MDRVGSSHRLLKAAIFGGGAFAVLITGLSAPAMAEEIQEVIVTARKRVETDIQTPVVVTAFNKESLARNLTRSVQDISKMTPGLIVGNATSSFGGAVTLRGIGSGTGNPAGDQAVSLNIDGIQLAGGNLLRTGFVDMESVEVLKGPQALFFGKNSPGGIIAIRSADPTDTFESYIKTGYEYYARQITGEGAISGPITEKVSGRLAFYVSHMKGYYKNDFPALDVPLSFRPVYDREPQGREYFLRGTLKFTPNERLNVRAKITYDRVHSHSGLYGTQRIYCPGGVSVPNAVGYTPAQIAAVQAATDCKPDNILSHSAMDPASVARVNAAFGDADHTPTDGSGIEDSTNLLASIEANYELNENITLTSLTGGNWVDEHFVDEYSSLPTSFITGGNDFYQNTFSQEVRVQTHYDSPINIMAGGFWGETYMSYYIPSDAILYFGGLTGGPFPRDDKTIRKSAYSGFGQVTYNVTDTIELAAGARYTRERVKAQSFVNFFVSPAFLNIATAQTFTNTSPEATITWRPTSHFTAFFAYKNAFKSGGFDAGVLAPLNAYRPEKAKGVEGGIKYLGFNRTLRLDMSAYHYKYIDLQVGAYDANTTALYVINAGEAAINGFEMSATYVPPAVEGLTLRGAFNYNRARYTSFDADCYAGQSIARGCNRLFQGGSFKKQDLTGQQLNNAPDWSASAGVAYEFPLAGDNLMMGLSADGQYSSSYYVDVRKAPGTLQESWTKLNASARIYAPKGGWELAVIGKNLTNKYIVTSQAQDCVGCFTGVTGTNVEGTEINITGVVARGREVWLQLTVRPGELMQAMSQR